MRQRQRSVQASAVVMSHPPTVEDRPPMSLGHRSSSQAFTAYVQMSARKPRSPSGLRSGPQDLSPKARIESRYGAMPTPTPFCR